MRRCWRWKEKALDQTLRRTLVRRGYGPAAAVAVVAVAAAVVLYT